MDSRVQFISSLVDSLTEKQKKWTIPNGLREALENCSLQVEELFELRYLRILDNSEQISEYLSSDGYFARHFQDETKFLHVSLWVIDNLHVGVAGFEHVFFDLATVWRLGGLDMSVVEHLFDPDTNQFNPYLEPMPPQLYHEIDDLGNVHTSRSGFDRDDPNSAQWNFYSGLKSTRLKQRERFKALLKSLDPLSAWDEDGDSWLDDEDEIEDPDELNQSWDDPKNEVILANLEEVRPRVGRPKISGQDDRYALMYAKILMTRYYGNDRGIVPTRRSCILKVAEILEVAEHNRESFLKRIDRKLKRKMTLRALEQ